jgi:UDP-N-acetylglucosamine 2-epimerase (non-hydrolysing)
MPQVRRITLVAGARPNFIKIASLIHESRSREITAYVVHTGQHFSPEMSSTFFDDLNIPEPDCNLGIAAGTPIEQMAQIMIKLEPLLSERARDPLVVVGDVTSTLAAALVGVKLGIRLAHVEAGLRSFDRDMPEEINRVLTDAASDLLFTTEPSARDNLLREGISPERIFFVGNVMIDTLLRYRQRASESAVLKTLGLTSGMYALATLHRPSNVDDPERLGRLLDVLERIAQDLPVVFSVHPRTAQRMNGTASNSKKMLILGPQRYLDFVQLMSNARLVLTDSGGIQEETTILGVPCLTMRDNTERPVTIACGTNRLVGVEPKRILAETLELLHSPAQRHDMPELWDGAAAGRIFDVLERII